MDKEKIISHFGSEFYAKVLRDLEKYARLWELSDYEQIDYYSVNCIFRCVSSKYGYCVLKIGSDPKNTENEYHILREYNGFRYCNVYDADILNSALLIERIVPGTQLRLVTDLHKRLDLFYQVSRGLHVKPIDKTLYPTYMGWVSRITEYMRGRNDYQFLYRKMLKAEQICGELCEKYHGELLLHGDLHHDNILLEGDNRYRIIDPKGVIGDGVFDIPRFILNEFGDTMNEGFQSKYALIIQTLSEKFAIPEIDIRKLTYIEMCMANCWNVESREEPNMDEVQFTEKMMYL